MDDELIRHRDRGGENSSPAMYTCAAYPKEIALKSGSHVTIRPVAEEDQQAVLDFFISTPEEERFFLKEDVTSPQVVHDWVVRHDNGRVLALLALDGPKVVAEAVLIRRRGSSRSHIGEIRIVVAPGYRNRGLGTTLIRELCDIASDAGLEKVLFEVVVDREQDAVKAAEWLGFSRVATIEGAALDTGGHHHDVVLMAMTLSRWHQWTKY